MKSGTRFLGIDDSPCDKHSDQETSLIGVTYRGTEFIEDIRKTEVTVDGKDATEKVEEIYTSSKASEIGYILLDGINFAGLNIVGLKEAAEATGVPVIAVTRNRPDRESFYRALEKVGNEEGFWDMDAPSEVKLKDGETYIQFSGCQREEAAEAIKKSTIHGLTPEPIRAADMIGTIL
ncbi:MAG: hypothetical protein J07AB43_15030 [Candidatus Nanosalina sp. J07AB43]|nr:MAG: hypothetical protein J07AB43_15030 [Candidatus Nanosalina sp. J07AB43]